MQNKSDTTNDNKPKDPMPYDDLMRRLDSFLSNNEVGTIFPANFFTSVKFYLTHAPRWPEGYFDLPELPEGIFGISITMNIMQEWFAHVRNRRDGSNDPSHNFHASGPTPSAAMLAAIAKVPQ